MAKTKAEAMKLARKYFVEKGIDYVCWAVEEVYWEGEISGTLHDELKWDILNSIYPHFNVQCWLEEVAKIPSRQLGSKRMRDYRIRWMDHMIEEYEKQGD